MTRMRRAVRCQYDEFSDHPALRMSGNRTEQGVGSGRVELIGRSIRYSRRNVNMDPVLLTVGRLDDQRVLDRPDILELDPSRNPRLNFDALRFEPKFVERPDVNDFLRYSVHDALCRLHMRVRSAAGLG